MGKKYTPDRSDDPKLRPLPVNGDGDTSGHTEPIDGHAVPPDLSHDLPSVAAIMAAAGDPIPAPEVNAEAIILTTDDCPPCPYCASTRVERLTPTLTECLTCESVARDGDDPARMFRMPTVAIFGPMRHGMKRRQIIARDYACHTPTGIIRLAERLGYRLDDSYPYNLTFTRPTAPASTDAPTGPTE